MPIHDLSPLAAVDVAPDRPLAAIIIFHAAGDILNATLVSAQLRRNHPEYYIVFITCERYKNLLDHNPDIDQLIALAGDPASLDLDMPAIKTYHRWVEVFTPAAYFSPGLAQGWTINRVTREPVGIALTDCRLPVLVLSDVERDEARVWWSTLPRGRKVLIETEFNSSQSPWNDDFVEALGTMLGPLGVIFIFTAFNRPPFFDDFQLRFGNAVWCALPFRLNVELFNLTDAYLGVSSGISVAISSNWCRRDIPWIEVCHGPIWSHVEIPELREFQLCCDLPRFRDALGRLADRLGGSTGRPTFAPRFPRPAGEERAVCPICGRTDAALIRGRQIVECPGCTFAIARHRTREAIQYSKPDDGEPRAMLAAMRPAATANLPLLICQGTGGDLTTELAASGGPRGDQLTEGRLGAILAADTLDLQATPFEWLEQANYLLAPDGLLLIRVWNFGGFLSTSRGLDCVGPPHNRYFFTADSLRRILFLTGFLIEREWTETPAAEVRSIAVALGRFDGFDADDPAVFAARLAKAGRGERIVMIARKRGGSQHRISSREGLEA
jgi:hypothetical protein